MLLLIQSMFEGKYSYFKDVTVTHLHVSCICTYVVYHTRPF